MHFFGHGKIIYLDKLIYHEALSPIIINISKKFMPNHQRETLLQNFLSTTTFQGYNFYQIPEQKQFSRRNIFYIQYKGSPSLQCLVKNEIPFFLRNTTKRSNKTLVGVEWWTRAVKFYQQFVRFISIVEVHDIEFIEYN